VTIGSGV